MWTRDERSFERDWNNIAEYVLDNYPNEAPPEGFVWRPIMGCNVKPNDSSIAVFYIKEWILKKVK